MGSGNKRCLIVLTALRFSDEYAAAALASARRRGEDVVLCLIMDREISEAISGRLEDAGCLGERLRSELRTTIDHDEADRGHLHLEEIRAEACALGLNVQTRDLEGEFVESVSEVARECAVDRILVARSGRPRLARAFLGSRIDRLRRDSDCPVEVFNLSGEPREEKGKRERVPSPVGRDAAPRE